MTSFPANPSTPGYDRRFLALRYHVSLYPITCLGCCFRTINNSIRAVLLSVYIRGQSIPLTQCSLHLSLTSLASFRKSLETMAAFQPPELDLTRFPIPTQPFINGKAVDSTADDKHTLISSINDAVITRGLSPDSHHQLLVMCLGS